MHPSEEIVLRALEASKSLLSQDDYNQIFELNDHSEWGLAIELLSDSLIEDRKRISLDQFRLINQSFEIMNLKDQKRLDHLRELSKEDTNAAEQGAAANP